MMYQQKRFRLAQTDDASVLELPYKSGKLSMIVILPKAIDGLPGLEKSMTAESYNQWLGKLRRQEVRVWLPKFSATKDFELGDTLSAMGMPSAFSASAADFSGMDGQRDLFISKVIHKAYVNVDEAGTEAAAATAITMSPTAVLRPKQPAEFKADHPFIYLLRETQSGAILFMGRYLGPQ